MRRRWDGGGERSRAEREEGGGAKLGLEFPSRYQENGSRLTQKFPNRMPEGIGPTQLLDIHPTFPRTEKETRTYQLLHVSDEKCYKEKAAQMPRFL